MALGQSTRENYKNVVYVMCADLCARLLRVGDRLLWGYLSSCIFSLSRYVSVSVSCMLFRLLQ